MSDESDTSSRPKLPFGQPSTLRSLSDTFAFHSSPEAYIATRVLAFQADHPEQFKSRPAIHVKVLNRNVAIISSHAQITELLSSPGLGHAQDDEATDPPVVATAAYQQFMMPFFPVPNLLLSDGPGHARMRTPWEQQTAELNASVGTIARDITREHFRQAAGSKINIYESLKDLSWKILLQTFLGLDESDALFKQIQDLQEDLLRGQFSLFPVSVSVPFWKSPRKRGVEATERLEALISQHLEAKGSACPFSSGAETPPPHTTNHILMFTSSLAAKATASLLTAFLLNVFLFERQGRRLVDELRAINLNEATSFLQSIELETERLSPPIVGSMRRTTRDVIISSPEGYKPGTLIPKGWDAWFYFLGGGRDTAVYGEGSEQFTPERYLATSSSSDIPDRGFAFSTGGKQCLGKNLVRSLCIDVARAMLDDEVDLRGSVRAEGVRGWLGWDAQNDIEAWARDMKQFPTQRPAVGIDVDVVKL